MSLSPFTAAAPSSAFASATNRAPVVEARDLCFWFGEGELRKQILFDVSLSVEPGEVVLLTGPSGSGKTTLLTLLGALRQVRYGELFVLGRALRDASGAQLVATRREIGFIFQQHNLLPFLTVRQNVELMFSLRPEVPAAEARTHAEGLLTKVGLSDRIDALPSKISGGQKQRVAVARALALRPRLILADEPTAALDSHTGREVVNLLQGLAKEDGCAILMVTHDNRVLDVADRIVAMEDGRIVSA